MKNIKRLLERKFALLTLIWAVIIAVLSLVSINSITKEVIPSNDKLLHFVFYAILTVLLHLSIKKNKYNFLIIFIVVVYGIIIELLQAVLTKNRNADIYDAIANFLGAIVGFLSIHFLRNKNK